MMTIKQVAALLQCNESRARYVLIKHKIQKKQVKASKSELSNGGGRKYIYDVTSQQLLKIIAEQQRDPARIAIQQTDALSALEAVFGMRQSE